MTVFKGKNRSKRNSINCKFIFSSFLDKDDLSRRLKRQVNYLNLVVGYIRFVGKIILRSISGRKKARDIEDEYIDDYIEQHSVRPRGNPTGGKKYKNFK